MKELENQWLQEIVAETYKEETVSKSAYSHLRLMRNLCKDIDVRFTDFEKSKSEKKCVTGLTDVVSDLIKGFSSKIKGTITPYPLSDFISQELFEALNSLTLTVDEQLLGYELFADGIPGKPK